MYFPQDYVGQLVRLKNLQRCCQYNDEIGRIMYLEVGSGRWVVGVLFRGGNIPRPMSLKGGNLELVDDQWQRTTGSRRGPFNQNVMIQNFGGPSRFPAQVAALRNWRLPPSKETLLSFWGKNVYKYMQEMLGPVMDDCVSSRSGSGLFRDFESCGRRNTMGMVYSDGSKFTQAMPMDDPDSCGMFWPVLLPSDQVFSLERYHIGRTSCTAITVWCQAQAVSRSRPYHTHPDRVIIFSMPDPEPTEQEYSYQTTVTIEECQSDMGDTSVSSDDSREWIRP